MTKEITVSDETFETLDMILDAAEGVESIEDVITSLIYLANMKNEDFVEERLKIEKEKNINIVKSDPSYN